MAKRITTPSSTHPHGDELDDALAVVVVVVGCVVDVVDACDCVVVVTGALVVVVAGTVVVVVGGAVDVVVGATDVVVVVVWAPAPVAASPTKRGTEATIAKAFTAIEP